jgi:hypothetical protein
MLYTVTDFLWSWIISLRTCWEWLHKYFIPLFHSLMNLWLLFVVIQSPYVDVYFSDEVSFAELPSYHSFHNLTGIKFCSENIRIPFNCDLDPILQSVVTQSCCNKLSFILYIGWVHPVAHVTMNEYNNPSFATMFQRARVTQHVSASPDITHTNKTHTVTLLHTHSFKSKSHYDRHMSRPVRLGVRRPSGTRDQISYLLEILC